MVLTMYSMSTAAAAATATEIECVCSSTAEVSTNQKSCELSGCRHITDKLNVTGSVLRGSVLTCKFVGGKIKNSPSLGN
jgi:hypothetical protein